MRDEGRTRGIFKVYLQWPLFLSVLLIVLTAVVAAVSIKAGIIVSVFTIVYIGIALWLYFSRKRGILAGLIAFSSAYDQSRQNLLEEMLMPYAVTDGSGHLLWMNREFTAILEEDKNSYKNITAVFPEITKEMLATGGEVVSIHSCLGDRKFRIDLKQVMVDSLDAAVAAGGLEGQGSSVTAVYLLDETQTLKYMQQINDQKLVAGLIYLDNYDEALESVEEVRRSLLTALIDRKISKYISGMNGIVKKIEKDKYFFAIKQQVIVLFPLIIHSSICLEKATLSISFPCKSKTITYSSSLILETILSASLSLMIFSTFSLALSGIGSSGTSTISTLQ